MVDMLPFNIIVDEAGDYQSFDREWSLDESVSPEFVLFRALFWFVQGNSRQFSLLFEAERWDSIRDYIDSSFRQLGIDTSDSLNDFADMEERIQTAIGGADKKDLISSLLDTVPKARSGEVMFYPRLYWAQPDEHCSEANSLKATAVMGADHQLIYFDIPGHLAANSLLRFDPAERGGYFHLHRMRLVDLAGEGKVLLELDDAQEISQSLTASAVSVCGDAESTVFVAHDNDPYFEFKAPVASENLRVEIEMDWPHSEEYEVVRDSLNQQFGNWLREKAALQRQLDKLENTAELNKQLLADSEQLRAIKGSRSYRLMRKLTGNKP